jgi:UDP-glucuronate decarboxylase
LYSVPVKVARIFNTYGPRMHFEDGRIVSNFIHQALTGRPLTVNGDGRQTRSFCFVDDMVRALLALMDSPEDVTGPVNLGNPDEQTVIAIAELVLDLTSSKSPIEFRPLPTDDPKRRRPDIERARMLLDWRPEVPLEVGIRRTIENFRNRLVTADLEAAD